MSDSTHAPMDDRRAVLLLHGLPGHGDSWRRVADRFHPERVHTPTFRGFEPDAAGHGFPTTEEHAAQLVGWCRRHREDRLTVVAWSFSCQPLLFAVTGMGLRVERVVFIEPSAGSHLTGAARDRFGEDAAATFGPVGPVLAGPDASDENVARAVVAASGLDGDWDRLTDDVRRTLVRSAGAVRAAFDGTNAPAEVGPAAVAGLRDQHAHVVVGDRTRTMFDEAARGLAASLPGCRLHVVPGAGHMWPLTDPSALARFLVDLDD